MTDAERQEWGEYFDTQPSISEYQLARIGIHTALAAGVKKKSGETFTMQDFMLTQINTPTTSIDDMTEEQLNALAGVS